jgi:hypothetical protein
MEHLKLLKNLIQWIQPNDLKIVFKNNELDDLDLEDFVLDGLLLNFSNVIN